jgi:transposase
VRYPWGRTGERQKRRRFTTELEAGAARRLLDGGEGLGEVATGPGLSPGQLGAWRDERPAAGSAEALAAREAGLQRLKREDERLEEEVEILGKAAAFFARGIAWASPRSSPPGGRTTPWPPCAG